ncbi:flagellar basal body FlgE domain-containing protein, partial [Hydrogenovibrio sp. 3SP14C1]
AQIMGYPADADGNVQEGGNVIPLQIPPGDLQANATSELSLSLNLNSGQPVIDAAFNPNNANTYNYSTNATVFDSQGNARNLTLYFTKTAPNEWDVNGRLSGGPAGADTYDIDLGSLSFT